MSPTAQGLRSRSWTAAFSSLGYRNYRWFWSGLLAAFMAMQMGQVAQGWLIYDLTHSALALGLVGAVWGVPVIILSLVGGVVADTVEKRNLLILTQSSITLIMLIFSLLLTAKAIEFWHILVGSFLTGIIFSFNMPARQSILPDLVLRGDLTNAVALNSSAMNFTRIVGPALAGILIAIIQTHGIFYLITLCHLFGVFSLFMIPPTGSKVSRPRVSLYRELTEGIRYVWRSPVLFSLLIMAFVMVLFATPYQTLMPVFAVDVLAVGSWGLGMLMAATGVGALIGSLLVAFLSQARRKGLIMIVCGFIIGLSLVAFASVNNFYLGMFFLVFAGASSSAYMALNNSLIMINVNREVLGRVMSIYLMTWGLTPLGTLPAGALASFWGAPLTVALSGIMVIVTTLAITLRWPTLAQLE